MAAMNGLAIGATTVFEYFSKMASRKASTRRAWVKARSNGSFFLELKLLRFFCYQILDSQNETIVPIEIIPNTGSSPGLSCHFLSNLNSTSDSGLLATAWSPGRGCAFRRSFSCFPAEVSLQVLGQSVQPFVFSPGLFSVVVYTVGELASYHF